MKKTLIILLPVDTTERRGNGNSADALKNTNYSCIEELEKVLPVGASRFELTEFMESCNDQEIELENYWVTYVNIIN